jgi:hypothetical protein
VSRRLQHCSPVALRRDYRLLGSRYQPRDGGRYVAEQQARV